MVGGNDLIYALEWLGLYLPDWFLKVIFVLALVGLISKPLEIFYKILSNSIKFLKTRFYNPEIKQFVDIRNNFVKHLEYEVNKLNLEADWNDFLYTELEAEVEVDPSFDLDYLSSKTPFFWIRSFYRLVKNSIGLSPTSKVEKNLIQAIMNSKSRAFLVVGDPGAGKTVSLRHLFLEMVQKSSSKHKDAIVPIYLNLKHLNLEPDDISADKVHEWILEQLRSRQDRTLHEFLDKNFEQMLNDGEFFFLFDSFDEIPAVMDAQEEQDIVHKYARALNDFIYSQHQCRGLISSRPYRAPKTFIGQRMIIRSLSNKRIKKALYKYMGQQSELANKLWQELQHRDDLLYIARNPFYLGLLSGYAKENETLPERHYDLFEHFVINRAQTDEERLNSFGLTPEELVEQASILAFAMTRSPHIGLEVNTDQVGEITIGLENSGWNPNTAGALLDALSYSKLGRMSQEEPGSPRSFSFVHRRFHEYFCARYLRENPQIAPFENLIADNRWREVLVLLCEVLPSEDLTRIYEIARSALSDGITAESGSIEHRKSIEAIRFLRDGFRSRIVDLPIEIRMLCSKFIQKQFETGNLLDQKRAIEGLSIVDDDSIHSILEPALTSDSAWLRETALKSCHNLRTISKQIENGILSHLFLRYLNFEIYKDYHFYSILFSAQSSLHTFKSFLRLLAVSATLQIIIYGVFFVYGLLFNNLIIIILILGGVYAFMNRPYLISMNLGILGFTLFSYIIILLFNITKTDYKILDIITWILIILIFINMYLSYYNNVLFKIQTILKNPWNYLFNLKNLLIQLLNDLKQWNNIKDTILSISLMVWILKVIEISISNNFSITSIYSTYNFIEASIILLTFSLMIIGIVFKILNVFRPYFLLIFDQSKLIKFSYILDSRPTTAYEAVQILNTLKTDVGKIQFVSLLNKWLPIGTDPEVIIEEANKQSGVVRDKLYQLAEIWQDSIRK
ncbi:MAG: NACHT domain-containing protein [Spirochaetes bacterium]|nr:NACHT domain-containing protein [Spirochaetota bacterium]